MLHILLSFALRIFRKSSVKEREILEVIISESAPVWQSGKCEVLDRVQRKGLAMCLGIPITASLEAVEVEADVLPFDLRREELAVREFGKICTKRDTQPIKQALKVWE